MLQQDEILQATHGRVIVSGTSNVTDGVSTDSRVIARGNLFVALKGPHFDGHAFLADVAKKGASAALVEKKVEVPEGMTLIQVSDTLRALGDLASFWRRRFSVPCVAMTGSNGKTTTKEMIVAMLSEEGPLLATEGNWNNLIGLPLTIFRWSEQHRVAILEMGMNASGEIQRLTEISRPTIGLITNVTAAHLEKLGTVEAVAKAKGELFETMSQDRGDEATFIVNVEDPFVKKLAARLKGQIVTYGMQNDCHLRFLHLETKSFDRMRMAVTDGEEDVEFELPVGGVHNVMNALAALAVGKALHIPLRKAAQRLTTFTPLAMRCEHVQLANGVRVINDAYNANPQSVIAALRTVAASKRAGRFLAALGDMLELGDASAHLHEEVGKEVVTHGVDRLFAFGDFASDMLRGAKTKGMTNGHASLHNDIDELIAKIAAELRTGDVLLVKGSRGMRMERVVHYLKQHIGCD